MNTILKRVSRFSSVLLLAAAMVLPGTASAAGPNPSYCDPGIEQLTNVNFQTKVPVVLVHGINGQASDWGDINNPSTFSGKLNSTTGVAVAHQFHYNTLAPFNNPDSGPKLAKTIDCISRLSTQNGGQGKVIVVGYSEGGLVARDALGRRSTDNQRAIADEVGQVVTIGTPHQFVPWLTDFPSQTVVHTIAGDVTRVDYFQGNELRRADTGGDTLVPTTSAHAQHTDNANIGGGQTTVTCEKAYRWTLVRVGFSILPRLTVETAQCEHGELIKNANNGVREDTVEAIKKYVASLTPSVSLTIGTVGSLTTKFDSRWLNASYGALGAGRDGFATDTTNGAPCTNCTGTPNPTVYARIHILGYFDDWCSGPILPCTIGSSASIVGAAPPVTIGGRTPDSSAHYKTNVQMGYAGYDSLIWCFEEEKVCVGYGMGTIAPQLAPSQALLDVFSTATWAP